MKNNQINFKITILYSIFWVAIFYSSYSYLKTIKPFQIKNIIINGNEFIETKSILASIQILLDNKNLFNTEIEELKNILNKNKFIDNVKIYSLLPSTIKINIIEKKPIALINNNNNSYFIDNNSSIIEADIKSINHFINTPIITSNNNSIDNNLSKTIIMSIYKNNEEVYNQLNELIYEDTFISLIFNNHTKVKINKDNYKKDLMKFYSFINQIINTENISIYEYIDLSISNQIIVKERKIKI